MCVTEQLVTNLHVLKCRRLHEYVPVSEHTAGCGCEAGTKWLFKLGSRLYDAMGKFC